MQAASEVRDDGVVGTHVGELRHLLHAAQRHPPYALRVALAAHGRRQEHVGERHGRGGEERVGHHDEVEGAHRPVDARRVGRHVGDRVRGGKPEHADGIRLAGLDGLQDGVRVGRGAEPGLGHERVLRADALGLHLGGKGLVSVVVRHVLLERVADDDVAARHVRVAGDGPQRVDGLRRGDADNRLVNGQAPVDGGGLGLRVGARRPDYGVLRNPAHRLRPLRRPFLDALGKLVEAVAPLLDELAVVEVLGDDDVEHGQGERAVGAGAQAQPIVGTGRQPGERRVDGDQPAAALHAVDDPASVEVVGVRGDGVAPPDHDHLRRNPLGVLGVVAALELL